MSVTISKTPSVNQALPNTPDTGAAEDPKAANVPQGDPADEAKDRIEVKRAELGAGQDADVTALNVPSAEESAAFAEIITKLHVLAGAINGAEAGLGDVDFPVDDEGAAMWFQGNGLATDEVLRRFQHDDFAFQGEFVKALAALKVAFGPNPFPGDDGTHKRSLPGPIGEGEGMGLHSGGLTDVSQAPNYKLSPVILEQVRHLFGGGNNNPPPSGGAAKLGIDLSRMDPMALVQWAIRHSYLENVEMVRMYAAKVKAFNEFKKVLRDQLEVMRGLQPELASKVANGDNSVVGAEFIAPGNVDMDRLTGDVGYWEYAGSGGAEALANDIKAMEDKLASVGDDAQLANVDLQNMLQKMQQDLQMLSNIGKITHDISMAIIRNLQ